MNSHEVAHWFDTWAAQLADPGSGRELRNLHRWLWSEWMRTGVRLAQATNKALHLSGDNCMQPDVPHLFAGRPENTEILFVNINPGWDKVRNEQEDKIVSQSEDASWGFCRALFSRYPVEVGNMNWWSQMIGVAWRIVSGDHPARRTAREKREWADSRVSGWELLPLHSTNAGFLSALTTSSVGSAIRASMSASLRFAIRLRAPISIVASSLGSALIGDMASRERWTEIQFDNTVLPAGARAFSVSGRLVLAIPRQLVSKYSGVRFDDVAAAVRRLRDQAHG